MHMDSSCSRPQPSRLHEDQTHFGDVSQHSRGARLREQLVLRRLMSVGKVRCISPQLPYCPLDTHSGHLGMPQTLPVRA